MAVMLSVSAGQPGVASRMPMQPSMSAMAMRFPSGLQCDGFDHLDDAGGFVEGADFHAGSGVPDA